MRHDSRAWGGHPGPDRRSSTIVPYSRRPPAMDPLGLLAMFSAISAALQIPSTRNSTIDFNSQVQRVRTAQPHTKTELPCAQCDCTAPLYVSVPLGITQRRSSPTRAVTEKPVRLMSQSTRHSTRTHFAKPYENVKQPPVMNFFPHDSRASVRNRRTLIWTTRVNAQSVFVPIQRAVCCKQTLARPVDQTFVMPLKLCIRWTRADEETGYNQI